MREIKQPPKGKESFIDRAIAYFDPRLAVKRRAARTVLSMTGSYKGASKTRRGLVEFHPFGGSADEDINFDLPTLRERSRDMVRNNPIGGGAIATAVNSVVGTGMRLNARINRDYLGLTQTEAEEFEKAAEYGFRVWAEECDLESTLSFYEIQDLVFRSTLESGDVLVLLPYLRRASDAFGLKLQIIEGDRLSNPNYKQDDDRLSGGVKLDQYGKPESYYILNAHPGDLRKAGSREWREMQAEINGRRNVLHLYRKMRPGQHRGVPYLAPVIEALKQIERYTDAELMAAVISGMLTVFLKSETGEEFAPMSPTGETGARTADEEIKLDYGAIVSLAAGEEVETVNPGRPNAQFDPFVQAILRQVGMALEQPYEVLVKNFTSSYSASRAALMEAWRFYNARKAWMTRGFCAPVYQAWMTEAVLSGYLYAPGFMDDPFIRNAYLGAEWIGPTQTQIDPMKEVAAAEKRLSLSLTTRAEECMQLTGTEWEAKVPQIIREREMLGVMGTDSALAAGSTNDNDKTEDEEGEEYRRKEK